VSVSSEPAKTRRAFCSAVSSESGEPLSATASRVDHWVLVEYSGAWESEALGRSALSPELKEHLRAQLAALAHSRLLLVKKTGRRLQAGGHVLFGSSRPGEERFFELDLEHHDELLDVDLAAALAGDETAATPVEEPLYVVCTHGKRDRCCALNGLPLYDALRRETDPGRVWQSTHVGGDRFAGNLVVLPHGLYYGRVAPADAAAVLAAHAAGEVELAHYRGRSAYPFPVQAAERALREAEGLLGIDDLTPLGAVRTEDGGRRVSFRTPDSAVHELDVVTALADEPAYLTCESAEPSRARRYLVTAHRVVSR
jgi:hypothetical protein